MKNGTNKKRYKIITYFCVFLLVVVASVGLALGKTQNKVKADTPNLYYFDVDYTNKEYAIFILYVLDVANLQDGECTLYVDGCAFSPPYMNTSGGTTQIEFVRNSNYDYNDYDGYIYQYIYPTITTFTPLRIIILTQSDITFDNNTSVEYHISFPFYPTFQAYYDNGYNYGYDLGVEKTTDTLNEYWNNFIYDTYINTSGSGYQEIYQKGRDDGINANIGTQNWFVKSFEAVDSFLSIHIFPNITFGVLLGIPFVISVAWFIIRMFRGGGSD